MKPPKLEPWVRRVAPKGMRAAQYMGFFYITPIVGWTTKGEIVIEYAPLQTCTATPDWVIGVDGSWTDRMGGKVWSQNEALAISMVTEALYKPVSPVVCDPKPWHRGASEM
jgi:hypothetical protein